MMKRNLIAVGFGLALPVASAALSVVVSIAIGAAIAVARHDNSWRRSAHG
jgi:hypothetical protein